MLARQSAMHRLAIWFDVGLRAERSRFAGVRVWPSCTLILRLITDGSHHHTVLPRCQVSKILGTISIHLIQPTQLHNPSPQASSSASSPLRTCSQLGHSR